MRITEATRKFLQVKKMEAYQLAETGMTYPQVAQYMSKYRNFKRSKQWVYRAVKEIKEIKAE